MQYNYNTKKNTAQNSNIKQAPNPNKNQVQIEIQKQQTDGVTVNEHSVCLWIDGDCGMERGKWEVTTT